MAIVMRKLIRPQVNFYLRNLSSQTKLVEVEQRDSGIAVVSMNRAPVNSLNLELLTELTTTLNDVKKQKAKGIIITSSLATVFSAGLDIMEMYKTNVDRCTKFWNALQDYWMTLYGLEIRTAAAINGASPAGGCLTAIACEYRVIVGGKNMIGLNETKLGIVAPQWFKENYISTIGYRKAELALLRGTLFTPEEALNINLVDELASNKDDAIAKCEKYINSFDKIPAEAVGVTKLQLRNNLISWLKNNRQKDTEIFVNFVTSPKVQAGLEMYLQSLKKK
ncbi:enoyl-CoA delta isomerase 1, mitochondrial-like [Leptopilina heterotoma]|uniref:enoyl-CoA delta isomerase 1, mitochondrial-like n=1 Tax=Leptopilina heterotoma TaxID=63436 RepID=UPI001CA84249|nr:enoyl-CoA delta isomerase 1, mitochondrial-like [Leptopilina heterotoma]